MLYNFVVRSVLKLVRVVKAFPDFDKKSSKVLLLGDEKRAFVGLMPAEF